MSDGPQGDARKSVLEPEDDWFATPTDWFSADGEPQPAATDDFGWEEPADEATPAAPAGPPGLGERQLIVVLAAVGVAVAIAVAILLVRWVGGSDSTTTEPVTTAPAVTTPASTNPATTPATTTTTPATTTPGTTTTTPTTGGTTVTEVPTGQSLKPGMSGSSVLALQQALVQLGYDPGTPDGTYGPATTQAVTAFQGDNNLTQDGLAGSQTLDAINAALARG